MDNYIKLAVIYLSQIFLRIFFIFSIRKNRIFFSSFDGRNYDCNPKYIYEYMYNSFGTNYEYVWCLNDKNKLPIKYESVCVKFFSLLYFYYLFTSKIIISNLGREASFPKRNQQVLINTWHGGGAYKMCANELVKSSKSRCQFMRYNLNIKTHNTDYMISSCEMQNKAFKIDFSISIDRLLKMGMPRNDILFTHNRDFIENIRRKVCDKYIIDTNKILILYAPTQRRNKEGLLIDNELDIDVEKVCDVVKKRFGGEALLLYRYHVGVSGVTFNQAVNVTDYPDMQELLLAVDVLITDYSSSIWDYSFTYKPGFLYTPDLEQYTRETNFHTPIDLWPYPYAKTIDELCREILSYDEVNARKKINAHHALLGCYEHGDATKKVCDVIRNFINQ